MDLEIIKKLMEQLQEEMKYGKEDLAHRLGRHDEIKPEVKVVKIEGEMPKKGMFSKDDMEGDDRDMEHEDDDEDMMGSMPFGGKESDEEECKEDDLKKRLMKLRG